MARQVLFVLLTAMFGLMPARAASYTTNVHSLNRFFDAFEKREGPVRVLSLGDSMADSWRSITLQLVTRMLERRPFAGTSLNNSYNRSIRLLSNGGTMEPPSWLWFSYHYRLPQGAGVRWYNEQNANGILANRLGLFWIAQPDGGQFELLVSEKGQAATHLAMLDGFSPAFEGRFFSTNVPLSEYQLEVRSVSGTNYVLDPELVNLRTNGLHVAWIDYSGIPLPYITMVPRAVREPILRSLAPDLLIWHFKEDTTNGLGPHLLEHEEWFRAAAPNMDVLYIGTPFAEDNTGGTRTFPENELIRSFAISQNRAFVDCMTPGVSYEWLHDRGYMDDPVHTSFEGGVFLGNVAWNDLGFYTLGTNRRVDLRQRGTMLSLEASLSAGLAYRFESSTDSVNWSEFASRTNLSGLQQFHVPVDTVTKFHRMQIRPLE
ncbi:MAG TPA: hypothetical protein VF773_10680 [Verrucomicrobiae bacterium]